MATIAEIIEKLKANVPFEKLSTLQKGNNTIVDEVQELAEEIKEDFDNFSKSDRFLNSDTQLEQDGPEEKEYQDFDLLVEVQDDLPPDNDDSAPLNSNQAVKIIKTTINHLNQNNENRLQ